MGFHVRSEDFSHCPWVIDWTGSAIDFASFVASSTLACMIRVAWDVLAVWFVVLASVACRSGKAGHLQLIEWTVQVSRLATKGICSYPVVRAL